MPAILFVVLPALKEATTSEPHGILEPIEPIDEQAVFWRRQAGS